MKTRSVREILGHRDWTELAAEANYDARNLVTICNASARTLERVFHDELQISPQRWLDGMRDFAAVLMAKNGVRKKEITDFLGYKHQAHLSRRLRRTYGA